MKLRAPALLLATLLAPLGCAPTSDPAAEEEALRAISSRWQQLDREQDAQAVADLFADDGAAYWHERPPAVGTEEIRAHMATAYAENPSAEGTWGPERYRVAGSGDLAVEEGTWEGSGGMGRYVTVYEKVDAAWKIVTDVSLNTMPAGGAPEWAQSWLESWYDAFNDRDATRLAAMYTPDAVVGEARGRRDIEAYFRTGWEEADVRCSGGYDGFKVSGDFATGWGRDVCRSADTGEVVERSTWLAVYDRQPNGSWLGIRDNGVPVE